MSRKLTSLIAAGILTIIVAGCATVIGGGDTQEVNFDSNPEGAEIWIGKLKDGEVVDLVNTGNVTPKTMEIKRRNVVVVLKKEGYEDTNIVMQKTMNAWFLGNIFIGGLIGSSIDLSTGAINKYDPSSFFVEMKEKP